MPKSGMNYVWKGLDCVMLCYTCTISRLHQFQDFVEHSNSNFALLNFRMMRN